MTTHTYSPSLRLTGPYAATVGFFDGLHLGHAHLLQQLHAVAAERHLKTLVVTFDRHPRQTLQPGYNPQLLTTLDEKQQLFQQTAIDTLVILPFTTELASLTANSFMADVLRRQLDVTTLLTGYDNRFGALPPSSPLPNSPTPSPSQLPDPPTPQLPNSPTPQLPAPPTPQLHNDYRSFGATIGLDVLIAEPFYLDGDTVSSSRVRRLLADGHVAEAAHCLGRSYTLTGTVVHGQQIGRTLGFPTANIQPDHHLKLIPRPGVYAVTLHPVLPPHTRWSDMLRRCRSPLPLLTPSSPLLPPSSPGLLNIGTRPTFGPHPLTLEAHLFDYSGNLYGQHLRVDFVYRLRDEQTFPSAEALTRQMRLDAEAARRILQ